MVIGPIHSLIFLTSARTDFITIISFVSLAVNAKLTKRLPAAMAYNERWSSCACSHACVLLWEISASYAWWESKNWGLREGTCIKLAQTCIYYTTLLFFFVFAALTGVISAIVSACRSTSNSSSFPAILYTPAPFREVMWRSYSVPFCSGQFVIYTMWMWDPRFWGPRVSIQIWEPRL